MGFLDVIGSALNAAENATNKLENDVERYKERYQHRSDEQLLKMVRHAYGAEQIAIRMLLKERGLV